MAFLKFVTSSAQQLVYLEIYKILSGLNKIISFKEIVNSRIGIREEYINLKLKRVSIEDKGIKGLEIKLNKNFGIFRLELKNFFFSGTIEMPFEVLGFTFNNDVRSINVKIGNETKTAKNYYSTLILWLVFAIMSIFKRDGDFLKGSFKKKMEYLIENEDQSFTIDLNKIEELEDFIDKPYWKFIRVTDMRLDDKMVYLQLHKDFAEKIISFRNDVNIKVNDTKNVINSVSESAKEKFKEIKKFFK